MTWIYAFIFFLPFMLVFAVKPEHGKGWKRVSLIAAPILYWGLMCAVMYLRIEYLDELWKNDPNIEMLSPLDVPEYKGSYITLRNHIPIGWLYGISITAVAEFFWRRKHKKHLEDMGVKHCFLSFLWMLIGLPMALIVFPIALLLFVRSVLGVFEHCHIPEMEHYLTFTEAIGCRVSSFL